jgi:hypothetical protein
MKSSAAASISSATANRKQWCVSRSPSLGSVLEPGPSPRGTATLESSPYEDRPLRISERFAEGSVEFEHIRRNSSYIADSMPSLLRALGYVGRNLIASVLILFWIPVALGLAGGYLLAYLPIAAVVPVPRYTHTKPPQMLTKQDILAVPTTSLAQKHSIKYRTRTQSRPARSSWL